MVNWMFEGQGKLTVALTGLSYEGIWAKNSLAISKFSYQNGFSYTGEVFAPVFERTMSKTEILLNEKVFNAKLQAPISSDKYGLIQQAVTEKPFDISLIISDQGSLIDDSTFVTTEELDYFGQVTPNPKESTTQSPYGRIFQSDSLYEGQVMNKEANGIGRLSFLVNGKVVMVYGYWKDGLMIGSFKSVNN